MKGPIVNEACLYPQTQSTGIKNILQQMTPSIIKCRLYTANFAENIGHVWNSSLVFQKKTF